MIRYSIDGGATYQDVPSGVIIHISTGDLHIIETFTKEGVVRDITDNEGEIVGTWSETYTEIEEDLLR